jgi:HSP20 family protein
MSVTAASWGWQRSVRGRAGEAVSVPRGFGWPSPAEIRGWSHRVGLPAQVDAENIEARLSDGVLTVRVPKAERAKQKKIEVKS